MPRKRKDANFMPCYGCNGTGVITKRVAGKKVVTNCTSCNGQGGWPKR